MAKGKSASPNAPTVIEPTEDTSVFDEEQFVAEMSKQIEEAMGDVAEPETAEEGFSYSESQVEDKPAAPKRMTLDEIIVPDDADVSGFFKGKPVTEVFRSHKHAEDKIRELGEKVNILQTQVIAAQQVKDVIREMGREALAANQRPEQPHDRDPLEGLNLQIDPIKDPDGFYREVFRRAKEEAVSEAANMFEQWKSHEQAEKAKEDRYNRSLNSLDNARMKLAQYRPEFQDVYKFDRVGKALINEIVTSSRDYPGGLASEESYLQAYSNLYGPLNSEGAKSVPNMQPPQPRPASVRTPSATPSSAYPLQSGTGPRKPVPTLRQEQAEAANQIASMILMGGLGDSITEDQKAEMLAEVRQRTALAMQGN